MKLATFTEPHLAELMQWFPDQHSCTTWGGPEFRFPYTEATFREDLRLELPSYALVGDEGELLGFGQYYLREERCHLARLVVAPGHRGRGAGAFLIRALVQCGCSALKVSGCSLFVYESNLPALGLYTRLGFLTKPYPGTPPPIEGCIYMITTVEQLDSANPGALFSGVHD